MTMKCSLGFKEKQIKVNDGDRGGIIQINAKQEKEGRAKEK